MQALQVRGVEATCHAGPEQAALNLFYSHGFSGSFHCCNAVTKLRWWTAIGRFLVGTSTLPTCFWGLQIFLLLLLVLSWRCYVF